MTVIPRDPRPLLETLRTAFDAVLSEDPVRRALATRCLDGLERTLTVDATEAADPRHASRPPACRHLARALANAGYRDDDSSGPAPDGAPEGASSAVPSAASSDVARAFAGIEPGLGWYRRGDPDAHGAAFHEGHANAFVIGGGANGLDGGGAMLGVTLMAPGVRYPDHRHAPEELYLVLSSGHWRHGESSWFEPGIGGVVHNVPHVVHAMRSDAEPLLAIWCLLPTDRSANGTTSPAADQGQAASR